jgi:hypothetical protein
MPKKITNHKVKICLGRLTKFSDKLEFLSEEEREEFANINFTGKDKRGNKTDYKKYLNSLNKGIFNIGTINVDSNAYTEEIIVTRLVPNDNTTKVNKPHSKPKKRGLYNKIIQT